MRACREKNTDISVRQTGKVHSLKVLLVEHPASDHLQVLKHTQVSPFLWPGINVQIACTEKSKIKKTKILKTLIEETYHALYNMLLCSFIWKIKVN